MKGLYRTMGPNGLESSEVTLEDGRIAISPSGLAADRLLIPGFVDLHIHGAFGIDFMSASADELMTLVGRLESIGYEALLPTTVTAGHAAILGTLQNLPDDPRIWGFHLEGPFISPEFPGAQPPQDIREPSEAFQESWNAVLDDPRLRVVTLAPERPGGEQLIQRLAERGVRVSMGHSNATYEQANHGFQAGARHTTHTFNAMRGLHHREAGLLGYALLQDELYTEIICDRRHVCLEAAEVLLKCKPLDRVIAVSDGTMASGMPSGAKLDMWGHSVEVRDGSVFLSGTQTLAGSAITLYDAFRNLAEDFGLETAIRLCCLNPRRALGVRTEPMTYVELTSDLSIVGVHRVAGTKHG